MSSFISKCTCNSTTVGTSELNTAAAATQLPTATADLSRTFSELHNNDGDSVPIVMHFFQALPSQ